MLCTHPGAAPGSDALPAEEVPTGGGCAVPPLLQAQRAARLAPGRRLPAPASNEHRHSRVNCVNCTHPARQKYWVTHPGVKPVLKYQPFSWGSQEHQSMKSETRTNQQIITCAK